MTQYIFVPTFKLCLLGGTRALRCVCNACAFIDSSNFESFQQIFFKRIFSAQQLVRFERENSISKRQQQNSFAVLRNTSRGAVLSTLCWLSAPLFCATFLSSRVLWCLATRWALKCVLKPSFTSFLRVRNFASFVARRMFMLQFLWRFSSWLLVAAWYANLDLKIQLFWLDTKYKRQF